MKTVRVTWWFAALALALSMPAIGFDAKAQDKEPQPQMVATILKVGIDIEESNPPNLVVTATGQVPTGGYTKTRLLRATYTTPPDDGMQDYFLLAVPPGGIAPQIVSKVSASNTWKAYTKEAPWLKGIRVHGVGKGLVVEMLKGK